jgi:hypothetical protein
MVCSVWDTVRLSASRNTTMLYSQRKVNLSLCLVKRYSPTFLTSTNSVLSLEDVPALRNVEASVWNLYRRDKSFTAGNGTQAV